MYGFFFELVRKTHLSDGCCSRLFDDITLPIILGADFLASLPSGLAVLGSFVSKIFCMRG